MVSNQKAGKQVLNPGQGRRCQRRRRPSSQSHDAVAVVGQNKKMLMFPLSEVLPEMS